MENYDYKNLCFSIILVDTMSNLNGENIWFFQPLLSSNLLGWFTVQNFNFN